MTSSKNFELSWKNNIIEKETTEKYRLNSEKEEEIPIEGKKTLK